MKGISLPSKRFTFKQNILVRIGRLSCLIINLRWQDPGFAQTRRGQLDRYLQTLMEDAGLGASIILCEFLNPASRMFPKSSHGRSGVVGGVVAVASFGFGTVGRLWQVHARFAHCTLDE